MMMNKAIRGFIPNLKVCIITIPLQAHSRRYLSFRAEQYCLAAPSFT